MLATAAICALWSVQAIGLAFAIVGERRSIPWFPSGLKSSLGAIGFIWGVGSVASLVIWWLFSTLARRPAMEHQPARRQLLLAAGRAGVVAPFAGFAYGAIVERTNFQVKETVLPVPGLHPDLEGLRIGQLTDLHVSRYLSPRDLRRAVDMMNELRPHLVAVTGDLITRRGDPLDEAIRELSRLRADAGVVGSMGNHEEYAAAEQYVTEQAARYGIAFLTDQNRQFRFGNGTLNIGGVPFETFSHRRNYIPGAENLLVPGAANLLLSHNPDVFPTAVRQGWDAMLSGHTHGGQVTVEFLNQTMNFARLITPYVAGLYRLGGASCYVSAGLGTIAMPVRLGAPPEVTLLKLTRAERPARPAAPSSVLDFRGKPLVA